MTAHYQISYDDTFSSADGLTRAAQLMDACEQDFDLMAGWFAGTDFEFSLPVNVELHNAAGGASWNDPPNISLPFGYSPTVTVKAVMTPPESGIDFVRYLLVSEVTEMFMASKDNGWFEPTSLVSGANEGSKGEGLSRFLGAQLKLERGFTARYLDFEVVPRWLNSPTRANYVDNDPDDFNPDAITGCTTCFLYYLHDQLGYGITDIINAGAATLGGVYQKLTGRTDGWTSFIELVNTYYPPGISYNPAGDAIFPVAHISSLGSVQIPSAASLTVGYLTFDTQILADIVVKLASDNPAILSIQPQVTISVGDWAEWITLTAAPITGPMQTVGIRAGICRDDAELEHPDHATGEHPRGEGHQQHLQAAQRCLGAAPVGHRDHAGKREHPTIVDGCQWFVPDTAHPPACLQGQCHPGRFHLGRRPASP